MVVDHDGRQGASHNDAVIAFAFKQLDKVVAHAAELLRVLPPPQAALRTSFDALLQATDPAVWAQEYPRLVQQLGQPEVDRQIGLAVERSAKEVG